jgi:flavin-dependent dehydrogenase
VGETFDAVVIGAGVNGMVAAATLAKARLPSASFPRWSGLGSSRGLLHSVEADLRTVR